MYCKYGYFHLGENSRKCWHDISQGGNFHYTSPISFIKGYVFYFRVGVIFAKKTTARKTRKLPPHENFHVYSITNMILYPKDSYVTNTIYHNFGVQRNYKTFNMSDTAWSPQKKMITKNLACISVWTKVKYKSIHIWCLKWCFSYERFLHWMFTHLIATNHLYDLIGQLSSRGGGKKDKKIDYVIDNTCTKPCGNVCFV